MYLACVFLKPRRLLWVVSNLGTHSSLYDSLKRSHGDTNHIHIKMNMQSIYKVSKHEVLPKYQNTAECLRFLANSAWCEGFVQFWGFWGTHARTVGSPENSRYLKTDGSWKRKAPEETHQEKQNFWILRIFNPMLAKNVGNNGNKSVLKMRFGRVCNLI